MVPGLALLCGCGQETTSDALHAEVIETGSDVHQRTEDVVFNNCDATTDPLTGSQTVSRTLSHQTHWEFGAEVGVGGEVQLGAGKLNIGASVSQKYGRTEGSSTTTEHRIDYVVPPGKEGSYIVEWREVYREGFAVVGSDTVKYSYSDSIRFAGVTKLEAACDRGELTVIPGESQPSSSIDTYVGTWTNVDVDTRGITRLVVTRQGNDLVFNAFGKCHPRDCNWGKVKVPFQGEPLVVPYSKSFAETRLSLSTAGQLLEVRRKTHFTDNSGRADQEDVYRFRRRS
jgi:hypothetical protein